MMQTKSTSARLGYKILGHSEAVTWWNAAAYGSKDVWCFATFVTTVRVRDIACPHITHQTF